MLICRQDTSFDQEVREAFSLLTCEEHKMGMSWLNNDKMGMSWLNNDKTRNKTPVPSQTFADHLSHLKDKQKLKKEYTKKFQEEDHTKTPVNIPYFPSVTETLEAKTRTMQRCISRAGVTEVFKCMSDTTGDSRELGLSQDDVETSFRSVQSKRAETRLKTYRKMASNCKEEQVQRRAQHSEMDQQLAKSARPLQAQYVPGMYSGEVRSAVTLNPMFPDVNHLSDVFA